MELGRAIGHIQVITYLISAVIQNTRHMRFFHARPLRADTTFPMPMDTVLYGRCQRHDIQLH